MVEGFKHTEIGEYPIDWIVEDFGEIISSVQLGGNYPNNDEDGEFILIKMGNLNRGYIDFKKKYYIKKGITPTEIDRLHFGDVIFNTRNTLELVGKVAIWKNEANPAHFNSNVMRIKFKEEKISSNDFMNLILNTPKSLYQLRGIATGTTSVAAIYPRDLFKIKIPYPTKAEQTAIATALNDADALIQKLEQLIAKKRNIKTGAMQELLKPKEGWIEKEFNQIFKKLNGKIYQLQTKDYLNSGSYPIIDQGQNVIVGYTERKEKLFKCPTNGIIVFGDHTRILKFINFDFAIGADGTQLLDVKEFHSTKFMYYYLLNNEVPNTGYNRHFKFLFEMRYVVPESESEQNRIAQILFDMDNEIQELEKHLEKYKMIKQGMMQSLLTGKIRLV